MVCYWLALNRSTYGPGYVPEKAIAVAICYSDCNFFNELRRQFYTILKLLRMSHETTRSATSFAPWDEKAREMAQSVDDERIQKAIERKRLISSKGLRLAPKNQGVPRLFDHFMIVGIPPGTEGSEKPTPRILYIYPATPVVLDSDEINQVIDFCFPGGIEPHGADFGHRKFLLDEFIFRLNGCDVYGSCQHLILNPRRIPFFADKTSVKYPFCLCLLSRVPVFSAYFSWLVFVAGYIDRLWDPVEKILEPPLVEREFERYFEIDNIEITNGFGHWKGSRFSEPLAKVVVDFWEQTVKAERDQRVALTPDLSATIPHAMSDIQYISYPTLDILYSCLEIPEIVKLYTAVLLEHHVLVQSESLHKVTFAIMAVRAMLTPFAIGATLLPIVPNTPAHMGLLGAPVPFIAGILKTPSDECPPPKQCCIVDLDLGTVTDLELKVQLPGAKQVIAKMSQTVNEYWEWITMPPKPKSSKSSDAFKKFVEGVHPFSPPARYLTAFPQKFVFPPPVVDNILKILQEQLPEKLRECLIPCLVTDSTDLSNPVTVLNDTLFASYIPRDEQKFYKAFMGTMIFELYSQGKTDETDTNKLIMNETIMLNSGEVAPSSFDPTKALELAIDLDEQF